MLQSVWKAAWQSNNLANFNLRLEMMWHLLAGVRVPAACCLLPAAVASAKTIQIIFSGFGPPCVSISLTLIHIHVRQMANGCTGEMKSVFDFVRVSFGSRSEITADHHLTGVCYGLSPRLPLLLFMMIEYRLWTRIHSTSVYSLRFNAFAYLSFTLLAFLDSNFSLSLSMRPSATTKCINNRETNFKAVRKKKYFILFIYVCMYICILCVYRNMSKSLLPVLFSLWLPHCSALKWDAVASVNIEAICAQCAQWVSINRVEFYI